MKKHINLITRQRKYYQADAVIRYLRIVITVLGAVFIAVNLIFFVILYREQNSVEVLLNEKKNLLDYLIKNKEGEARFIFFNTKEKQVATILKGDVNFYPYYNLLSDSLKRASPEGELQALILDKNREVSFTIGFEDYPSLISFFKFMETNEFLKNFTDLTLQSVDVGKAKEKNSYVLNLKGTFMEIL